MKQLRKQICIQRPKNYKKQIVSFLCFFLLNCVINKYSYLLFFCKSKVLISIYTEEMLFVLVT